MGLDQQGVYERVVINRESKTVAIDRFDINWRHDGPFVGLRDFFMPAVRSEGGLDFIRHHYWLFKLGKPCAQTQSHWAAWCYKRALKRQKADGEKKQ